MASSRAMGDYLTTHNAPAPVEAPVTWRPCPTCWGQGRILIRDDDGPPGYLPRICATCLGVASIPDTEGQP